MVKEETPNIRGGAKPKGGHFQQSTSTQKESFKGPAAGLEDKVFKFVKQKHTADFVNNCEGIYK